MNFKEIQNQEDLTIESRLELISRLQSTLSGKALIEYLQMNSDQALVKMMNTNSRLVEKIAEYQARYRLCNELLERILHSPEGEEDG